MIAVATPMREKFAGITDTETFGYSLRDFLDRFREAPSYDLIAEEPELLERQLDDGGRADAFLASTAAYLAHRPFLKSLFVKTGFGAGPHLRDCFDHASAAPVSSRTPKPARSPSLSWPSIAAPTRRRRNG